MGRKKKPVKELTSDGLARRLFPNKVVAEAKKIAHERDGAGEKVVKKSKKKK